MDRTPLIKIVGGSNLYGTSTEQSDLDIYGVVLPTRREILLGRATSHTTTTTRPEGRQRNSAADQDEKFYTLARYLELLVAGDMISLEILYAPKSAIIGDDYFWHSIRESCKTRLVSRQAVSGITYVRKRIERYGMPGSLWRTKSDLADAAERSARMEFQKTYQDRLGLLNAFWGRLAAEVVDIDNVHVSQTPEGGYELQTLWKTYPSLTPIDTLCKELRSRSILHNMPVMAPVVGSDLPEWKIIAHAMRVADQVRELHETGSLTFPRPVAGALREVRAGAVSYSRVEVKLVDLLDAAQYAVENSVLREAPEPGTVEDLIIGAHMTEVLGD